RGRAQHRGPGPRRVAEGSVEILFREGRKAGRGAHCSRRRLRRNSNDRDGPARRHARLVFPHRAHMPGDGRAAVADGRGPPVELGNAETPDFLLVGGLVSEHGKLSCAFRHYRLSSLARDEIRRPYKYGCFRRVLGVAGSWACRGYSAGPNTASILVFSVAALNGLTM